MCNLNAKGNSPLANNQTLFEEVHECCAAAKLLLTTQANTKPLVQYKNIALCGKKSFQANDKCPPFEGKVEKWHQLCFEEQDFVTTKDLCS